MISTNTFKLKTQSILAQRIKSLCSDGYTILFNSHQLNFNFVKLRHRSNGSIITIQASVIDDFMVQRSNGKIVYQGKITA